jgi:hypothetical protein
MSRLLNKGTVYLLREKRRTAATQQNVQHQASALTMLRLKWADFKRQTRGKRARHGAGRDLTPVAFGYWNLNRTWLSRLLFKPWARHLLPNGIN